MKRIQLLPIIFFVSLIPCLAQEKSTDSTKIASAKTSGISDYKSWQKIELKAFSFYAPKELKQKEVKCIEGGCYTFESEDLILNIDINPDAGRPTFETIYPSYLEKFTEIDGKPAWIWHWEDKGVYKYVSGVNFKVKSSNNWGDGIYLFSKSKDTKQIAEKIFMSVKFNRK